MDLLRSKQLTSGQTKRIFEVWNAEYPAAISFKAIGDFESYLSKRDNPTHFLALNGEKTVIGWLSTFTRDNARWFSMLVSSAEQGKGVGTRLVEAMKHAEEGVSGWIISKNIYLRSDGSPYRSPEAFYRKTGFDVTGEEVDNGIVSTVKIAWRRGRGECASQ